MVAHFPAGFRGRSRKFNREGSSDNFLKRGGGGGGEGATTWKNCINKQNLGVRTPWTPPSPWIFPWGWSGSSFFPTTTPTTYFDIKMHQVHSDVVHSPTHMAGQVAPIIAITAKEFVPVVAAAATWGQHWKISHVLFRSDNMAIVEIVRKRTSADPHVMHLLWCFAFYATVYHFTAQHIVGQDKSAADAISHNNFLTCPTAPTHSCPTARLGELPATLGLTDVDSFVLASLPMAFQRAQNLLPIHQILQRLGIDTLPFMERSPLQQYSHALWGGKPFVRT